MAHNILPAGASVVESDLILKTDSILRDKRDSNYLIDLIQGLLSQNENEVITAVDCLQKVFSQFLEKEDFSTKYDKSDSEPQSQYRLWLLEQFQETKAQLINMLCNNSRKTQNSASLALLSFLNKEVVKNNYLYPSGFLNEIIKGLLSREYDTRYASLAFCSEASPQTIHSFHIMKTLYAALKENAGKDVSVTYLLNAYAILKINWIPKITGETTDVGDKTGKGLKLVYSQAWLEFLKFQIPFEIYKTVLVDLHEKVLPNMKNPLLMTDFLTESYNYGGVISLLALNGLFFLIQNYNLEYPNFFIKLYALLTEDIFQVKYRPRFFYLLDLFLSSTHLPVYLVGAFSKKLSRLSLLAPPDVLLIIIPFVRNLMVRHPSLKVLINQSNVSEVAMDPFLHDEKDPAKCGALESSLWEIKTLQSHWHPSVSKEASFVNKLLPSKEKDLSELFETNYVTLFDQEVEAELSKVPLSYDTPKGLFSRNEDKMFSLWTI